MLDLEEEEELSLTLVGQTTVSALCFMTEDYLEVTRYTFERDGAVLNMADTHSRAYVGYLVQLGCDLGVGRHNC